MIHTAITIIDKNTTLLVKMNWITAPFCGGFTDIYSSEVLSVE